MYVVKFQSRTCFSEGPIRVLTDEYSTRPKMFELAENAQACADQLNEQLGRPYSTERTRYWVEVA